MEKTESNKLIAEFMSCKSSDKEWQYRVDGKLWKLEGLKYDKSWSWLMPVVEKINNPRFGITYRITHGRFTILDNGERGNVSLNCMKNIVDSRAETTLEAVYNGVVEYIKQTQ